MEKTATSSMKRILKTAAKALFVIGLLYFLSQKGFISLQETKKAFEHRDNIAIAVALLGINILFGAIRWQWLLRAQGITLKTLRVFELTLVGNFFNIALPGAVSGDFVKAFYIGKEIQGQRARAFGSILFDRVAGLSALVLLSAIAMALGFQGFSHDTVNAHMMAAIKPFVLLSGACVIAFYAYLFLVREHHDPVLAIFRRVEKAVPKAGSLTRIYESIRHYHNHRGVVCKVLAISLLIHFIVGWVFMNFAYSLGEDHLLTLAVFVIFPLGLLVTAVPVAPAGVGTGHAAFLYFFGLIGSQRGADIFTLFALGQIFYSAIGGLVYLRFRSNEIPGDALSATAS